MAYRSSSNLAGASSQTTAVVPVPTGAAIGDIAVVGVYKENTAAITPPAGFTQKAALSTTAASRGSLYVFWKRLTAADTGTYSFTWTGSTFRTGGAALFSGRIATGDPFDGTVGTAESVAAVLTLNVATTPAAALGDAVGLWTNFNSGNGFTQPTNYLERVDNGDLTIATRDAVAAGATGNVSATSNLSDFMKAFLGVLAPAGGGGTTPVTATRATTWRVTAQVTGTRATTWDVLSARTSARATTWDVLTSVSGTRATTWRVRAAVTATRATTWNVASTLASVTASRATTWRVRAQATSTRATTWDVLTGITGTRATTWRVRAAVTSTRSTTWNVASTLATVTATRATTWRVAARVTATRATTWDVTVAVSSTRATTWDVLRSVSGSRATTWDVLASRTQTRATTWRVKAQVTGSRSTTWEVLSNLALRDITVIAQLRNNHATGGVRLSDLIADLRANHITGGVDVPRDLLTGSVEYVTAEITFVGETAASIASATGVVQVTTTDTTPTVADPNWAAPAVTERTDVQNGHAAMLALKKLHTAGASGEYHVWAKVTDNPEIPILKCGTFTVR